MLKKEKGKDLNTTIVSDTFLWVALQQLSTSSHADQNTRGP